MVSVLGRSYCYFVVVSLKKTRKLNNSKRFRRRVGELENYLYLLKISSLEFLGVIVV